ncbi:MAG: arsenate reductase (glutaredoxin) [Bacteroidia bacterium]|nr:arsenate reductase (glutaredoxin) [Bacteroidia bacterium]
MNKVTLYYNPRCSKCREALCLLEEKGIKPEIIEYLKTPPSEKELKEILHRLGLKPLDLIRTKEPLYAEKYKGHDYSDAEWIRIMCKNPVLIERPIAIEGNKAVVGRPAEKILTLLQNKFNQ